MTDDQMIKTLEAILGSLRAMNDRLWWATVNHIITIAVLVLILYRLPPRKP